MADRGREEKRQWGHTTDPTAGLGTGGGAAGAPGTTGAFRTSDPLGAPGSTGAGLTRHDPSSIPGIGGAAYLDPDVDYGGQQQQHRDPTSGTGARGREDFEAGRRQHAGGGAYTSIPNAGVGGGDYHDPGAGYGGHHQQQQLRDPTSDVGFGDKDKFGTSNVGLGDKDEFEGGAGGDQAGLTGFTTTTTATGPGGLVYGRQTRAVGLGSVATGEGGGGHGKKGLKEKAKDFADRIPGVGGHQHSSSK